MISVRKNEGFQGQKSVVLPFSVLRLCEENPVTAQLYITDMGYYPKAKFHYRERDEGIDQCILIYCTDGRGWVEIDGVKIMIEKGEFIIIPQNTPHKYGADTAAPWSIYWVHFKGESSKLFLDLIDGADNSPTKHVASFGEKRISLFNEMYNVLELGYSMRHLNYCSMILWNFLATLAYPDLFSNEIKKDEPVEIAIKFMLENLDKKLQLHDLAELVHTSTSHFSALFKKKTGYPPLEYFNHIKIQKACQYLEFSDVHIKDLCYELGFSDPFYFSRLFNKYMGVSPMDYRRQKRCNGIT